MVSMGRECVVVGDGKELEVDREFPHHGDSPELPLKVRVSLRAGLARIRLVPFDARAWIT